MRLVNGVKSVNGQGGYEYCESCGAIDYCQCGDWRMYWEECGWCGGDGSIEPGDYRLREIE